MAIPVLATTQAGPLLVSVSTAPNPYALEGETTVKGSAGVVGYGNSTSATSQTGVKGEVKGASAIGVEGVSLSTASTASTGVYGSSANGNGVQGVTTTNSKNGSSPFAGVVGVDSSSGQKAAGVYGTSPKGVGVYGFSTSGSAVTASSTSGVGVTATGGPFGVEGSTDDTNAGDIPVGVAGNDNTNFTNASGVQGSTANGVGVNGEAYGSGSGVYGQAEGVGGSGVVAVGLGSSSTALNVQTDGGTAIRAYSHTTEIMALDNAGNLTLTGSLTQKGTPHAVLRSARGVERTVYSAQQTQTTLEDFGEGQMTGGRAYVRLDPAFADMLDRNSSYIVFLTPEGPTTAPLYVSDKSLSGFSVREITDHANIAFGYRILARPSGTSQARLALYKAPPSAAQQRTLIARMHAQRRIASTPVMGITLSR
jgi:hypothetical protein